jgi:hypothetical protein
MPVTLEDGYEECERGNTWFVSADGMNHVIYVDTPDPARKLEVTVTPENYPGFYVKLLSVEKSTATTLAAHLTGLVRDGWTPRRIGVEGVLLAPADAEEVE